MGKQAGPAGVIALRRDEKLFMTIPLRREPISFTTPIFFKDCGLREPFFSPFTHSEGSISPNGGKWRSPIGGPGGISPAGPVAEPRISPANRHSCP